MTSEEKEAKRRPLYSWVLVILVFILSMAAIISGILLMASPDGSLLGMTEDVLKGTPFNDYTVPGVLLFLLLGIFPFVVGLGLINIGRKWLARVNPIRKHYWAWAGAIITGIIVIVWVIVETAMIGYVSVLQPVMGVWGALILCLTLLPQVRRYYRVPVIAFNPKKLY